MQSIHSDGPTVQAMVDHVLGQAAVLGHSVGDHEPAPVEARTDHEHERFEAAQRDGRGDRRRPHDHVHACGTNRP